MTRFHALASVAVLACAFNAVAARIQIDIDDCRYALDQNTKKAVVQKFIGPSSRKTVTIPDNIMNADDGLTYTVTEIGDAAFYQSNVVTVNFPSTIKTIGSCAFQQCPRFAKGKALVLPPELTTIGMEAFEGCLFTEVQISSSVKKIGESAFANTKLKTLSFDLPKTSLTIGNFAFRGCQSLTAVALPSRLTGLGQAAFDNCTSLVSASFPGTLSKVPAMCFEGCTSLTSVIVPSGVTEIGWNAFKNCAIKTINLPATLKTIGQQAFVNSGLTSIAIPAGVKEIPWMCFAGCSGLVAVSMPASMQTIESGAFWECNAIRTITCDAVNPPDVYDESVFSPNTYATATLNLPKASVERYSKAEIWEKFAWFLSAGISEVSDDSDMPLTIFTLGGVPVPAGENLAPGVYIVRKGNTTKRVLVR